MARIAHRRGEHGGVAFVVSALRDVVDLVAQDRARRGEDGSEGRGANGLEPRRVCGERTPETQGVVVGKLRIARLLAEIRWPRRRTQVRSRQPMLTILVVALILDMCNAMVSIVTWRLLPKGVQRPLNARLFGAALGGVGGALLTKPQLELLVQYLGFMQEAAGMAILFAWPFALPVSVGLGAWLLSEAVGGRNAKLGRPLGMSLLGALLGAAVVFVPVFFVRAAGEFFVYQVAIALPILGAVLGLFLDARWRERAAAPTEKGDSRALP